MGKNKLSEGVDEVADQVTKAARRAEREVKESMAPQQWLKWAVSKGIEPFYFLTRKLSGPQVVDSRSNAELQTAVEQVAKVIEAGKNRRATKHEAAYHVSEKTGVKPTTIERRTKKTW